MGRKKKVKSKEIVESDPEEAPGPDDATIKKKRSTRGGGKTPQSYKKLGKLSYCTKRTSLLIYLHFSLC